ncbi:4_t:CDS:1, partial [Entrophospora sp. SA101]
LESLDNTSVLGEDEEGDENTIDNEENTNLEGFPITIRLSSIKLSSSKSLDFLF